MDATVRGYAMTLLERLTEIHRLFQSGPALRSSPVPVRPIMIDPEWEQAEADRRRPDDILRRFDGH
jgi:hypothetical protein